MPINALLSRILDSVYSIYIDMIASYPTLSPML
jgi:hypothetical protein